MSTTNDPYNIADRRALATAFQQMGMSSNYGLGGGPAPQPKPGNGTTLPNWWKKAKLDSAVNSAVNFAPTPTAPGVMPGLPTGGWSPLTGGPMNMPAVTINLPEIPQYSSTLPGLTAEQEAQFDAMRGAYDEQFKQAENMRAEGLSRLGLETGQADNRLRRQGYQSGVALRDVLSERGLGFSPMFLNRGMRDISGQVAAQRSDLQSQRASREEALNRMFQQAEQDRNRRIAELELQRALIQSAPSSGLIGGVA